VTIDNRTLKQKRSFALSSSAPWSRACGPPAGDRAALERHYNVRLEGAPGLA
jgi:hypothetical protein